MADNCPWGDGRGNHVKGVSGCGCPKDPEVKKAIANQGNTPIKEGKRCPKCRNIIDKNKPNHGHHHNCAQWISEQMAPPRNQPHNPVKVPQHSGPWKKQGGVYKNEAGLRVQNWKCQTTGCGRISVQLSTAGQPQNNCPEIRGKR